MVNVSLRPCRAHNTMAWERPMLHLDFVRELVFIVSISVATCILAFVYASLEKVFPFLKGGLGRMN